MVSTIYVHSCRCHTNDTQLGPRNPKWHLRVSAVVIIIHCNFMSFQRSWDVDSRYSLRLSGFFCNIYIYIFNEMLKKEKWRIWDSNPWNHDNVIHLIAATSTVVIGAAAIPRDKLSLIMNITERAADMTVSKGCLLWAICFLPLSLCLLWTAESLLWHLGGNFVTDWHWRIVAPDKAFSK